MSPRHAYVARCAGLLLPAVTTAMMLTTGAGTAEASSCPDHAAFTQPPTPVSGDWKAYLSEWSILGGPGENYSTSRGIAALTWWGFLDEPVGDTNPKAFRLTFFSTDNDLSLPNAVEHEYNVLVAPQMTGQVYDSTALYEFHATLSPPCPLRRGWIVIEGSGPNPSRPFYWISSDQGDGISAVRAWWGSWYWVGNVDLALCLEEVTCPPDVNNDGSVNVLDLLAVLAAWGATAGPEDVNCDGIVDVLDALEVLGAWGPCP